MTDTFINPVKILVMTTLFCCGCAGAPLSPAEMAKKRLAAAASEWSGETIITIRYNPARCDCPEFEALLNKKWYRTILGDGSGTEPVVKEIYDLAIKAGPGWTSSIRGAINGIQPKKYRSAVLKLDVKAICAWPGCESGLNQGNPGQGSNDN